MGYWEPSSGATNEWYTPSYVFDALGCEFDLDVAHPERFKTSVPCRSFFSEGGLDKAWHGFVWMNPPFGGRNGLEPWLNKFFAHGDGIALTPDRTSAPWWQTAAQKADALLFVGGKIKFERPDGTLGKSPSTGTTLFASGEKGRSALARASGAGLGFMALPKLQPERLIRSAA